MPSRILTFLALCAAVSACAPPIGPGGNGQIPAVPIAGARMAPAPLSGTLRLPPGPGPHPVVILLHGCGGITPGMGLWAERLEGWGYGSLILDSFSARGVRSVCAPERQPLVTRYDRAGDAIAAARWLRGQAGVDGGRIAVLGDSHGGATAATLALKPFTTEADGVIRAAVDYYGACRTPSQYGGLPLLALAGTADTWSAPARQCEAFAAAVPAGSPVSVAIYPGVVHGFDNPRNVRRSFSEGHPMQYDRDAAEDSFGRVRAFLDRTIGPAAPR